MWVSDSLLLKAEKILVRDAVRNGFYGQEINIAIYKLYRINMFLHDIGFDKFDIACEDPRETCGISFGLICAVFYGPWMRILSAILSYTITTDCLY